MVFFVWGAFLRILVWFVCVGDGDVALVRSRRQMLHCLCWGDSLLFGGVVGYLLPTLMFQAACSMLVKECGLETS